LAQQAISTPANPAAPGTAPATPQSIQDVYRQQLMGLLQGPTPDQYAKQAATSPQVAAYNTQQQRAYDKQRAVLAEQAARSGLTGSGGANTQVLGLGQAMGENESAFAGQVAQQLWTNRQNQLMDAIKTAQQAGQFDAAQALQEKLAQLQASVTTAGQQIQQQLGEGDLALREKLGMGDLDLRNLALQLQNSQQADQLGFNYATLQEQANEAVYNALAKGAGA